MDPWIGGVVLGVVGLSALVAIYNYGIDKGYRAGRETVD